MLGVETQRIICDFFKTVADHERRVEAQRQRLALYPDFEPYQVYQRINASLNQRLTVIELYDFLRDNNVLRIDENDVRKVIEYFDTNRNGALNYKEFLEIVMPCDDMYLRSKIAQRPNFPLSRCQGLPYDVEQAVASLFECEILYHTETLALKHQIVNRHDWDQRRAFERLADQKMRVITCDSLLNFCRIIGYYPEQPELAAMIRRLDVDADAMINFEEFLDTFGSWQTRQLPKSPSRATFSSSQQRQSSPQLSRNRSFNLSKSQSRLRSSRKQSANKTLTVSRRSTARKQVQFGDERRASSPMRQFGYSTNNNSGYKRQGSPMRSRSPVAARRQASPLRESIIRDRSPQHVMEEARSSIYDRRNSPLRTKSPKSRSPNRDLFTSATAPSTQFRRQDLETTSPRRSTFSKPQQSSMFMSPSRNSPIRKPCTVHSPSRQDELQQSFFRSSVTKGLMQKSAQKHNPYAEPSFMETSPRRFQVPMTGSKARKSLKFDEEEALVSALREQIMLERELENAKIKLASYQDFNLLDAFQLLDSYGKTFLTGPDIQDTVADQLCYDAHKEHVYLFVRRYDNDADGRLLYSDICNAFVPVDSYAASELNQRPAYYYNHRYPAWQYFTAETREQFAQIFKTHMQVEESGELLRKRLSRRPDFNVHDAFSTLDRDANGYLSRGEFSHLLAESGFYATEAEITLLMNRYDTNRNGRVSYAEFMEEIIPKSQKH